MPALRHERKTAAGNGHLVQKLSSRITFHIAPQNSPELSPADNLARLDVIRSSSGAASVKMGVPPDATMRNIRSRERRVSHQQIFYFPSPPLGCQQRLSGNVYPAVRSLQNCTGAVKSFAAKTSGRSRPPGSECSPAAPSQELFFLVVSRQTIADRRTPHESTSLENNPPSERDKPRPTW